MSFHARAWGTLPVLTGCFVVGGVGCGSGASQGGGNSRQPANYVVTIEAASVAALGACPHDGAVGLVTSTADGGTTYTLYRCNNGGNWTAIPCNNGQAGSVAYVPGSPGSLFACV